MFVSVKMGKAGLNHVVSEKQKQGSGEKKTRMGCLRVGGSVGVLVS